MRQQEVSSSMPRRLKSMRAFTQTVHGSRVCPERLRTLFMLRKPTEMQSEPPASTWKASVQTQTCCISAESTCQTPLGLFVRVLLIHWVISCLWRKVQRAGELEDVVICTGHTT
ncbi:hypothetical protein VZT92_004774 [Zoarces viviparus]|uniref:Uncharacterized protein n=1 Tax=Zoarces viviparus TaxID=48416 RepID=A0AAW1FSE8_ZOAVI